MPPKKLDKQKQSLKKVFVGPGWAKKVDSMSDDQITAVYLRLKKQGKIKGD